MLKIPEIIDHKVGKKKFISFKYKLDQEVDKIIEPENLLELIEKVAQQIRENFLIQPDFYKE